MASPSPSRQVVTNTMLAQMCAFLHSSLSCILLAWHKVLLLLTALEQYRRWCSACQVTALHPCRHGRGSLQCGDDTDAADSALQHPRPGKGPKRSHGSPAARDLQSACSMITPGS
jgi:hypothetical protein